MNEPHYEVIVHSDALDDLRRAYGFVRQFAPLTVEKWFDRLLQMCQNFRIESSKMFHSA